MNFDLIAFPEPKRFDHSGRKADRETVSPFGDLHGTSLPWSAAGSGVPNTLGSSPMLATQSARRRAYWRVVIAQLRPRILTWPFAGFLQEVVEGLPGLIRQLELDRSPGLLLPDGRTIDRIAIGATSSTLKATTSQPRNLLSIARLIRARSRVRLSITSRVRIDQTWFGRSGGLAPISLPLSQEARRALVKRLSSSHDRTPRFVRAPSMRLDAQIVSAFRGSRPWGAVGPL